MNNTLLQVSWIVAPQAYCEHPTYPPNWGAWYISNVLDALTSNPEVWASTVLIINFDENDGFFDHLVPPTAPATAAEGLSTVSTVMYLSGCPGRRKGLSARSLRAWRTCSLPRCLAVEQGRLGLLQTFDHTSVIQFIEKRFGVMELHITPWRRAVCGDDPASTSAAPTHPNLRYRTPRIMSASYPVRNWCR